MYAPMSIPIHTKHIVQMGKSPSPLPIKHAFKRSNAVNSRLIHNLGASEVMIVRQQKAIHLHHVLPEAQVEVVCDEGGFVGVVVSAVAGEELVD